MSERDLIPWGRNRDNRLTWHRNAAGEPFAAFHREVDPLFDDFFQSLDIRLPAFGQFGRGGPDVEISETDTEIKVSAELPGMEENDVELTLDNGMLFHEGEKTSETQDADKQFSERGYGRFERRIPLGVEVDEEKVTAEFRNGVLIVTLPKSEEAKTQAKRIAINS